MKRLTKFLVHPYCVTTLLANLGSLDGSFGYSIYFVLSLVQKNVPPLPPMYMNTATTVPTIVPQGKRSAVQ